MPDAPGQDGQVPKGVMKGQFLPCEKSRPQVSVLAISSPMDSPDTEQSALALTGNPRLSQLAGDLVIVKFSHHTPQFIRSE